MASEDTTPALLSADRLADLRQDISLCRDAITDGALRPESGDPDVYDAAHRLLDEGATALLAHLDALTPRAVDGDALGFGLFLGDMRETDNRATREAWAQMEPDPKAEYVSRALDLHAIGYAAGAVAMTGEGDDPGTEGAVYILMERHDRELHEAHAAGRSEGEAERAALAAELAKRDAEIEGLRREVASECALTEELRAASERHEREAAEARAAVFEHSAAETDKRVAAARIDGAREELARVTSALRAKWQTEDGYEGSREVRRAIGEVLAELVRTSTTPPDMPGLDRATEGRQG